MRGENLRKAIFSVEEQSFQGRQVAGNLSGFSPGGFKPSTQRKVFVKHGMGRDK
jgi:hypothetical protein